MNNESNSSSFKGQTPILFSEHPDINGEEGSEKDWGLKNKLGFINASTTKCYDLDNIALKLSDRDSTSTPLRTIASPDVLIIEEKSYTFVEFKSVKSLGIIIEGGQKIKFDPAQIKTALRNMVFKHVSPKVAGAAIFCTILATDLHNRHYLTSFHASSLITKIYFVINDTKLVTSFETQIKSVVEEYGRFGFKIEIHSIDYFISEILPKLKSVLKVK